MRRKYQFYADFFNGHEEDGEPQPKPKTQKEESLVIGTKVKEKDLWYKIRRFLRRV